MAIEEAIYTHPWTRGNFVDSLRAGYQCCVLKLGTELIGYFVLMVAAGEAHLLNLSIAAPRQRAGYGSLLLREAAEHARSLGARSLFPRGAAEQSRRAGALHALRLQENRGAPRLLSGDQGREDALVLTLQLA
jgi:ribosomal-protein-alanine N-acetyltransferase